MPECSTVGSCAPPRDVSPSRLRRHFAIERGGSIHQLDNSLSITFTRCLPPFMRALDASVTIKEDNGS
jgi:hypothetical protein